jgi:hypothetical protein
MSAKLQLWSQTAHTSWSVTTEECETDASGHERGNCETNVPLKFSVCMERETLDNCASWCRLFIASNRTYAIYPKLNNKLKISRSYWFNYIHIFLTSALVGGEWSASRPGRFTPGTHFIGGWVDPRAGLDDMEKYVYIHSPIRLHGVMLN